MKKILIYDDDEQRIEDIANEYDIMPFEVVQALLDWTEDELDDIFS